MRTTAHSRPAPTRWIESQTESSPENSADSAGSADSAEIARHPALLTETSAGHAGRTASCAPAARALRSAAPAACAGVRVHGAAALLRAPVHAAPNCAARESALLVAALALPAYSLLRRCCRLPDCCRPGSRSDFPAAPFPSQKARANLPALAEHRRPLRRRYSAAC